MQAEALEAVASPEIVSVSPEGQKLELRVRDVVHGTLYTTLVDPEDTVLDLKQHLSRIYRLGRTRELIVIRKGKLLRDEMSFESLGISADDVLAILEHPDRRLHNFRYGGGLRDDDCKEQVPVNLIYPRIYS